MVKVPKNSTSRLLGFYERSPDGVGAPANAVEAAYRRVICFEKRRALADVWARYCDGVEVVSVRVELQQSMVPGA